MPAPRRRLRLLAALTALTLLGAACSDDDESGDDPTVEDTGGDDTAADDGSTDDTAADDDGGDDGGESAAVDACSLITTAELEQIIGSPYGEGAPTVQADTGSSQCTWTNTDAPPIKDISVVVDTTDSIEGGILGQAIDTAADYYEVQKNNYAVDEDLDIGDEAFRAGGTVVVLDGDTLYTVLSLTGTDDAAVAAVKAVAEAVAD